MCYNRRVNAFFCIKEKTGVNDLQLISTEHRRFLRRIDFFLLLSTILIIVCSLIVISSATHVNTPSEERFWYVQRQGIFALVNFAIGLFCMNFDYRGLQQYGSKLYIFNLILLVAVMLFGHAALGAQRWIQIGFISIQPSEFSKLIMIICLASALESRVGHLNTPQDLFPIVVYVGIPFVLVLKQPDLGTSLVFMAILFGMLIACGINWKLFASIVVLGIASLPVLWQFLKDYQKMRIMVFLDPNVDPLGSGYHIIQSKIAIGSGMMFGKGLFEGTQSQLNFLPENHTDFIFAVIGEEFGFVGAAAVLFLYLIVLWRGMQIARDASDMFGRLLAVGITSMLAFHVLVNVGMTTGIMPVTGIPLPLMSYGISSLTTNILSVAILMNIHLRKQKMLLFS
ncbi:MAG: rod shape-determining protein RodA [Selenomonadaceae bacterium]|nr:rod shape-determining protein RodA [Selenomonadaceae bacterium]